MFLGTARTSFGGETTCVSARGCCFGMERTSFGHLHQEQLLALLRFSDVCRDERVLQ